MKTMTCKQLWWACDLEFHAETFEDMASQSKAHGMEMMQQNDPDHLDAMKAMMEKMQNPGEMEAWYNGKKSEFEALPHS